MKKFSAMQTAKVVLWCSLSSTFATQALAKLPPPSQEEAAKAAAAKEKAAEDAKVEKVLLEKTQDRIAAQYIAQQKAKGITVTPTPIVAADAPKTEIPSAALNTRPTEKAGAYNEAVTPQSAPGAMAGNKTGNATTHQNKENVPAK